MSSILTCMHLMQTLLQAFFDDEGWGIKLEEDARDSEPAAADARDAE